MSESGIWQRRHEITLDGTRLSAEVLGDDGAPLVICVHGFPDTPDTWVDLAPALHASGRQVVAPFLRGYPPSEAGPESTSERLGRDVLGFADAMGAQTFELVGHDWGANAAYAAAALAPERIRRLVTIAIPHNGAIRPTLELLRRANHFFTLPLPGTAARIRRRDFEPIREIVAKWAPTWEGAKPDVDRTIEVLRQPGGIEGALQTYTSFLPFSVASRRTAALLARPTAVPTLSVFGARDGALDDESLSRTKGFFTAGYEEVVVPGVGHFPHREAPEVVVPKIVEFLSS